MQFSSISNTITRVDAGTWGEDGFLAGLEFEIDSTSENKGEGYFVQSISPDNETLDLLYAVLLMVDTFATVLISHCG